MGPKLTMILLPSPLECWDYRYEQRYSVHIYICTSPWTQSQCGPEPISITWSLLSSSLPISTTHSGLTLNFRPAPCSLSPWVFLPCLITSPKAHQPTEKMLPMPLVLTHVAALFPPCLPTLDFTGHFISGAMPKDHISG